LQVSACWGELNSNQLFEESNSEFKTNTYYDLASLTKVILTSSLLVETCQRSHLPWDDFFATPLSEWVDELNGSVLERISIRQFWEHRSGLAPHINIPEILTKKDFSQLRSEDFSKTSRQAKWKNVLDLILSSTNHLGDSAYSDLGFLLIGLGLERFYERNLDELWNSWKKDHSLRTDDLIFAKELSPKHHVCASEARHKSFEVNDDNAFYLDGVAPHAGLFGTAAGIAKWMSVIHEWVSKNDSMKKWIHQDHDSADRFYYGWDRPQNPKESHAGESYPADLLGHLGYTGTALWWTPSQSKFGVLLTNRVCPAANKENAKIIKNLRREFFSGLWQGTLKEKWQIPKIKSGSI